jgi:hypothetical protein
LHGLGRGRAGQARLPRPLRRRIAITNACIVGLDDQAVTIRHKHRKSNRWRTSRIPGQEFMRRFLHVHRVRRPLVAILTLREPFSDRISI